MNLPIITDSHCHLDMPQLSSRLGRVLESAFNSGVRHIVVPGVHPSGWETMARIADENRVAHPAFGIHPMHGDSVDDALMSRLEKIAPSGVAIGEIGLDKLVAGADMKRQEEAFRLQLRLAVSLGLPVLVHCRGAIDSALKILKEERIAHVGGIMHAFSGSPESAREFIRCGMLISICGNVTWENAVRPGRLATSTPLDSLALESDSPDLSPQGHRGEPNEPAWLCETLSTVAALRGQTPSEVAFASTRNVTRLLKLPDIIDY